MASLEIPPEQKPCPSTATETFTILYFASAASYTGIESEKLPAPLSLAELFNTLESRYSGIKLKVLKGCAVTIDLEYVDMPEEVEKGEQIMIKEGSEVGIIPPVSSG